MAYQNPGGGAPAQQADDDYFSDGPMDKEDSGGEPEATLPKALLGGKKFAVGDEIVLRIEQVNEDSFVVSYAPEHDERDERDTAQDESDEARPPHGSMDEGMMD